MLKFKNIKFSDRDLIKRYTQPGHLMQSNYSFELNYIYRNLSNTMIAEDNGYMFFKSLYNDTHQFLLPIGQGDYKNAIFKLIDYLSTLKGDFRIRRLNLSQRNLIESLFPDKFTYELSRDEEEYVYLTEKLSTLQGKALQAKRNQVNMIVKHMSWSFDPITSDNIKDCNILIDKWSQNKFHKGANQSATIDNNALQNALNDFFILNLDGGILSIEQNPMAFAIGCPLNPHVYMWLFMRSDRSLKGVYQLLYREFVRKFAINYHFFNSLEDVGDPGLRFTKLSYQPIFLEEIYTATLKI